MVTGGSSRREPSRADEHEVLSTRRFYSGIGLWPQIPTSINPSGWLRNFRAGLDRDIAIELLDSFVHVPRSQVERLIESAFHNLSYLIERIRAEPPYSGEAWRHFRENVIVSYPQDALNDPAASGRSFIRQARAGLIRYESQLADPWELVDRVAGQRPATDVVFIDDFAGTGDQFIEAMRLEYPNNFNGSTKIADLLSAGDFAGVYYIPAIATASAVENIETQLPGVRVRPAHVLTSRYSASHPETLLVSSGLQTELDGFLRRHAVRAGYSEIYRYGHGGSGLSISFEHGVPDNTLPIFWSEGAKWTTLRRRLQP